MLVTTTHHIEQCKIISYKGIVTGEALIAASIVKDVFAKVRDFFGGQSGLYTKELKIARDESISKMKDTAHNLGANAIIGIDIDYQVVGKNGSMILVSVNGTAVYAQESQDD